MPRQPAEFVARQLADGLDRHQLGVDMGGDGGRQSVVGLLERLSPPREQLRMDREGGEVRAGRKAACIRGGGQMFDDDAGRSEMRAGRGRQRHRKVRRRVRRRAGIEMEEDIFDRQDPSPDLARCSRRRAPVQRRSLLLKLPISDTPNKCDRPKYRHRP